jgi:hypothetical protein
MRFFSVHFYKPTFKGQPRTNMSKLSYLDRGSNALTGIIPATIEKITNLSHIDIGGNNLYGNIPRRVCKMDLKYLSLAYNNFNGFI